MNAENKKIVEKLRLDTRDITVNYFTEPKEIAKEEDRSYPVSSKIESVIIKNLSAALEGLIPELHSLQSDAIARANETLQNAGKDIQIPEGFFYGNPREDFDLAKWAEKNATSLVRELVKEVNATRVAESEGLTVAPAKDETKPKENGLDLGL